MIFVAEFGVDLEQNSRVLVHSAVAPLSIDTGQSICLAHALRYHIIGLKPGELLSERFPSSGVLCICYVDLNAKVSGSLDQARCLL